MFSYDYIGHEINIDGVYESRELDALCSWISASAPRVFEGIAVDIGANIGNHSLRFADHFRAVYSFEPHPRTFKALQLNAELASNVRCFNVGLSDAERQAPMRVPVGNLGGARIVPESQPSTLSITVRPLDSLIDAGDEVRLIKIDVEGHEYQVLRGAERTIRKHQPLILFEQLARDFEGGKSKSIELLRTFGYRHFATVRNHPRAPQSWAPAARYAFAAMSRLLAGESMRVCLAETIEPGFYPLLVAVPDAMLRRQ